MQLQQRTEPTLMNFWTWKDPSAEAMDLGLCTHRWTRPDIGCRKKKKSLLKWNLQNWQMSWCKGRRKNKSQSKNQGLGTPRQYVEIQRKTWFRGGMTTSTGDTLAHSLFSVMPSLGLCLRDCRACSVSYLCSFHCLIERENTKVTWVTLTARTALESTRGQKRIPDRHDIKIRKENINYYYLLL